MIDAQDIIELAGELSLDPQVVEKDYLLGWLLAAISQHPELDPTWVFKGGTCLKKVFFETYRFSEDLDFTLLIEEQLNEAALIRVLREVGEWVYQRPASKFPLTRSASRRFRTRAAGPPRRGGSTTAGRCSPGAACQGSSST